MFKFHYFDFFSEFLAGQVSRLSPSFLERNVGSELLFFCFAFSTVMKFMSEYKFERKSMMGKIRRCKLLRNWFAFEFLTVRAFRELLSQLLNLFFYQMN